MNNQAVWYPSDHQIKNYRLYKWMKSLGFNDYEDFYQKSIDDVGWFWDEAVKALNLNWYKPYEYTLQTKNDWKYPRWFVNGKINVVENALEKWARHKKKKKDIALTCEDEDGIVKTYTYEQLQTEVNLTAAGFVQIGMQKGDVVTLYLPMIPEAVISMLSLAKIGCIFSPVFSGYGADAIATRINASGSKYVITADCFYRRGKRVNMKHEADLAIAECPSIKHVIVINRSVQPVPLNGAVDLSWESLQTYPPLTETMQTNSDDAFMLIYTSGTTGKPKGAVHTHGGFPIKAAFDAGICMDMTEDDTFFWHSDIGWMMGPFLVFGGLINGANIVLFDGVPDYPKSTRLLELCNKHRVTHLGISPTLIRSIAQQSFDSTPYDLSDLKAICSTGEPWNPEPWIWLFKNIGKERVPIINFSGGTEISGGILSNILLKPISPITFNSPVPGMSVDVFDEKGKSLTGEVGELVITKPWVGMTNGFWNEPERYEQAYWNVFDNTWVHGDWVVRDENGYWTITGRSDDLLNIAGKRVGPAEFESALIKHPLVIESASIGVPHPIKGECVICFAVLKDETKASIELEQELLKLTAASLGKALTPEKIYFVSALPKTRNGKIMRRVMKAAYLNKPEGDLSSLENIASLKAIRNLSTNRPE